MLISYTFISLLAIFSFSKLMRSSSFFLPVKFNDFVVEGKLLVLRVKSEGCVEGWILETEEVDDFL